MRILSIALTLALVIGIVWLAQSTPVSMELARGTEKDVAAAGPIVPGLRISQRISAPARASFGRIRPNCLGILTATYSRKNSGLISVAFRQGGRRIAWKVQGGDFGNNTFRYFCPGAGFDLSSPLDLEILGVEGSTETSPTVWLSADSEQEAANIAGAPAKGSLVYSWKHISSYSPWHAQSQGAGSALLAAALSALAVLMLLIFMQGKPAE